MKQLCLAMGMIVSMLLSFLPASAYDFEVDGLGYTITSFTKLECSLTSLEDTTISQIRVPDYVCYSNKNLNVTAIGPDAFSNCKSISKVVLGQNIKKINNCAFKDCTALKDVEINSGLMAINSYAFQGCTSLESLSLPSSVKIGIGMFKGCLALTEFIIPSESTSIPSSLFSGCTSLTSISIPSNISTIENNAFENCTAIREITIPANVNSIGSGAFNGCAGLQKLIFEESDEPINLSYSTSYYHEWAPTYSEYFGMFKDCPIKSLTIGRQLEFTSALNFVPYKQTPNGYNQRRDVHYPPFSSISLEELIILPATKVLAHDLFYNCNLNGIIEIQSATVPLLVGSIKTVTPKQGGSSTEGTTTVYNNFSTFLPQKIIIDRDIQYYYITTSGGGYYQTPWEIDGTNLECCDIGDNVTNGYPIIKTPKKLKRVIFGENVTEIKPYFCENAELLDEVYLGRSIQKIGKKAFFGCSLLSSISFPINLSIIDEYSFYNCENIRTLNFNNYNCEIKTNVFSGCTSLESIRINGTLPTIASEFSNSVYMKCKLEVPMEEIENVKKANIWKNFWNVESNVNCSYISTNGLRFRYYKDVDGESIAVLQSSMKEQAEIVIPESILIGDTSYKVIAISENAFLNDEVIISLTIPSSIKMVGNNAFNGYINLQELRISDSEVCLELGASSIIRKTEYKSVFDYHGVSVRSEIYYFNGLFYDTQLKNIYIGRNLSYKRSDYSFSASDICYLRDNLYASPFANLETLESIEIGKNVSNLCLDITTCPQNTDIEWPIETFVGSTNIQKIRSHSIIPPIGVKFSESTYKLSQLIVPDNTISLYQTAEGWKEFANILDEFSAGIERISYNSSLVPFTIANGGIRWVGDYLDNVSLFTIDGRLLIIVPMQTGEYLKVASGLYIIRTSNGNFKIRI